MPIPTDDQFEQYGMNTLPPLSAFQLLDSKNPIIYARSSQSSLTVSTSLQNHKTRWMVSPDGVTYYVYRNSTWDICTDVIADGMTSVEINSVPKSALVTFTGTDKLIYLKAGMAASLPDHHPWVSDISYSFDEKYELGSYYIKSTVEAALNTSMWVGISSCSIAYEMPEGTDIRFAFKTGLDSNPYLVYDNGIWKSIEESAIASSGMKPEDAMNIPSIDWNNILSNRMSVMFYLISNNKTMTPKVLDVNFVYNAQSNPGVSRIISIPSPTEIYNRQVYNESEDIYIELPVEGLGFDDANIDYDFYSTPNRIILRPLDMGILVGSQPSNSYVCEVVNTWETKNYNVELKARYGGVLATPVGNSYALLNDAELDQNKTKIELSSANNIPIGDEYPLKFRLNAQSKRLFYIRLTPNVVSTGSVKFDITLLATEIS